MDGSHWFGLADHIVIRIFSYVSQNDRFNLSLVCKEWSDIFHDSELWKHFIFKFDTESDEAGRALVCAEKYNEELKDVEIFVNQSQPASIERAIKVLDKLHGVHCWKLMKLKLAFTGQNPLCFNGNPILAKLKELLLSIKDKELIFDMSAIDLSKLDIVLDNNLLDILANHHKHLRIVHIQNQCLVDNITEEGIINLVKSCVFLEELYAFYHCINDEVIDIFSEDKRVRLMTLSLMCNRSDKFKSLVSSDAWGSLSRSSPDIELIMKFDSTMPRHMVIPILCPNIPVTAIDLHIFAWLHEEIQHISNVCSRKLTYFSCHTSVDPNSTANEELPPALLDLVSHCDKLQELHCHCKLPSETIDAIKALRTLKDSTLYSDQLSND